MSLVDYPDNWDKEFLEEFVGVNLSGRKKKIKKKKNRTQRSFDRKYLEKFVGVKING